MGCLELTLDSPPGMLGLRPSQPQVFTATNIGPQHDPCYNGSCNVGPLTGQPTN